jgi:hypothetical protein
MGILYPKKQSSTLFGTNIPSTPALKSVSNAGKMAFVSFVRIAWIIDPKRVEEGSSVTEEGDPN